jgi:hypothetical protein
MEGNRTIVSGGNGQVFFCPAKFSQPFTGFFLNQGFQTQFDREAFFLIPVNIEAFSTKASSIFTVILKRANFR